MTTTQGESCISVSYTHLDVYKRQTLTCPMEHIPVIGTGGLSLSSKRNRDIFADYFTDYFTAPAGSVPWQYDMI